MFPRKPRMLMNVSNNNIIYNIYPKPSIPAPSFVFTNRGVVSSGSSSNPPLNFSMVGRVFNVSSGCSSCGRG